MENYYGETEHEGQASQWPKHGSEWTSGVGLNYQDYAHREATCTDDGAGELGPPTVRTVHSSGGALWASRYRGWDMLSAAHVHVHVVVVVAAILRWILGSPCTVMR